MYMQRNRHISLLTAAVLGLGLTPLALQATSGSLSASAPTTASAAARTSLRVGTYNVRTARAVTDRQQWLERAPLVAREILARNPGVLALQELGPGRADGRKGTLQGTPRQTTSLLTTLAAMGGGRYRLVRTTPYVAPGTVHGTQGARILYDSSRYTLLTNCPETTGRRNYNRSCSIELPLRAGDSRTLRRSAAYAAFRDRRTGKAFYVASAHLDDRHSRSAAKEKKLNSLRARQAAAVVKKVARVNTAGWPVIFGGDINSWQTDRGRYAPHRALTARGFHDASKSKRKVHIAYPTINHFKTTVKKARSGKGVRLDVVMVKGGTFKRYENKMRRVNASRASDHNLVLGDVVL
jgi:endonuclease/exonuclease/phosphatase family metal-dependent hydrolase